MVDADSLLVGSVVSVLDADADSDVDSDTDAVGESLGDSSANAAGADSASGAMAAVMAAAARARRSFMKTSGSPAYCCVAVRALKEASACGARLWPLGRQV
ncbi:hypothetical protein GCM10010389_31000 [Streptomyces echinoruber]|uniref:Uncharacterized protein n=1 Tax=Streptomyces echinoruber TaxID=68898 RepID=A0A918VEB1_9ACTN|nr:hypothetical protein GCM10010389_31000 [Streptomyces echinoruber]